ncbi:HORMA domain-containing protein 1-like isoform X2 [Oppia nitens]|uniref:HORMA domain-containing protein 1-like isoform X2 n=1 Tax=Oppia nitens TaxID=1686743 RepID=UPI0023DC05F3|nr:HORMA domain-containing protein 1-like isoform X2 [Oppia nitens]
MTSTLQRNKTQSKTCQLQQQQQLFPMTVTSEQMSLNYMKRLTAVAISNILYLRNVFTEDCYGHRKLDQLKLRILTERCNTGAAKQMVQWVKGCFDAMEKKYLKQLTLGLFTNPDDPEELIEAYTLRYSYDKCNQINCNLLMTKNRNERSLISEQSENQELRHSTIQLLRSLIIMVQSLDKLPEDCYLTMKLLYYDDITPKDYEPQGFVASETDSFSFFGKPISINAGEVTTPWHALKLKIRTNQEQFQEFSQLNSQDKDINNNSQDLGDECTPLDIEIINNNAIDSSPMKSIGLFVKPNEDISSHKSSYVSNNDNVISKIKELSVEDDSSKRKLDFEVTQDSMFNAVAKSSKRFKSSKTVRHLSLKN